MHQVIFLFRH